MIEFRWLGVAGVALEWNGSILLVDPFLTRPPAYKLLVGWARPDGELLHRHLPWADHILVSHAHYDHLLDVPEIARYSGARVYGSGNTCRIAAVCGVPPGQVQQVQAGDVLRLPNCSDAAQGGEMVVEVLAGEHAPVPIYGPGKLPEKLSYPMRLNDFVMDEDFGFLIQAGETRLLFWHNWRPGPAPRAEVLVIGADILPTDLPELLDQVQPRLLIPTHWDNFLRPLSKPLKPFFRPPSFQRPRLDRYDPWKLKRMVERVRPGVAVWVPGLFERFTIKK
jgi:L-ascorbate metabolism protein UlaG (beta-lactamase superfamily)